MGWLFGWAKRAELIAHLTLSADWNGTGENEGKHYHDETLAHCYRGCVHSGVLWTVTERTITQDDQESRERWIGCTLLKFENDRYGGQWGYKAMTEAWHPAYYSCPTGYLDMVPVACQEWRDQVVTRANMNRKPKGLQVGDVVEVGHGRYTLLRAGRRTVWENGIGRWRIPAKAMERIERDGQTYAERGPDGLWAYPERS